MPNFEFFVIVWKNQMKKRLPFSWSLRGLHAQVMTALSDSYTTVLCALERRGDDDGVVAFLAACETEGFALQLVFLAGPDAPAPVKIYEFSKRGREGFRCAEAVEGCAI